MERELGNVRGIAISLFSLALTLFVSQGDPATVHSLLEEMEAGQNTEDRREIALRFGVALWSFWIVHSHWSEGRTFLERALAASEGVVTSVRAKALEAAASLAVYQIDHDRGETLCRENLAQCRDRGDTKGTAFSLSLLGTIAWQRGDFAVARALMEELSLRRAWRWRGN